MVKQADVTARSVSYKRLSTVEGNVSGGADAPPDTLLDEETTTLLRGPQGAACERRIRIDKKPDNRGAAHNLHGTDVGQPKRARAAALRESLGVLYIAKAPQPPASFAVYNTPLA